MNVGDFMKAKVKSLSDHPDNDCPDPNTTTAAPTYAVVTGNDKSWADARQHCQDNYTNGDLANFDDSTEANFITYYAALSSGQNANWHWIGAQKTGDVWNWVKSGEVMEASDGGSVTLTGGEYLNFRFATESYEAGNTEWAAADGTATQPFICQYDAASGDATTTAAPTTTAEPTTTEAPTTTAAPAPAPRALTGEEVTQLKMGSKERKRRLKWESIQLDDSDEDVDYVVFDKSGMNVLDIQSKLERKRRFLTTGTQINVGSSAQSGVPDGATVSPSQRSNQVNAVAGSGVQVASNLTSKSSDQTRMVMSLAMNPQLMRLGSVGGMKVSSPKVASRVEQKCAEVPEAECADRTNPFISPSVRCWEYKCPDGTCIPPTKRCDGMSDCDGSITGRSVDTFVDTDGTFTVTYGGSFDDTGLGADEWRNNTMTRAGDLGECLVQPAQIGRPCITSGPHSEFQCSDPDKSCIPDVWYCDGILDCPPSADGVYEDEQGTACKAQRQAQADMKVAQAAAAGITSRQLEERQGEEQGEEGEVLTPEQEEKLMAFENAELDRQLVMFSKFPEEQERLVRERNERVAARRALQATTTTTTTTTTTVSQEFVKHWIGVQLEEKVLIQCVKVTQPHLYAIDEMMIYGCDLSAVFRLGVGQVLRRPDVVCNSMKPVALPFNANTLTAMQQQQNSAASPTSGAMSALASSAIISLSESESGRKEVESENACKDPRTPGVTPVLLMEARKAYNRATERYNLGIAEEEPIVDEIYACFCMQQSMLDPTMIMPPFGGSPEKDLCAEWSRVEAMKVIMMIVGASGVIIINQFLIFVIARLVRWEKHHFVVQVTNSQFKKLFLAQFMNSFGCPPAAHQFARSHRLYSWE
jgi:hypothetical protein